MKDQRFTELLNLYIDREISPAEAAELEAEITRLPARRREYQHYCRLHKACAQIFERECARAPASFALEQSLRAADRKLAAPEARRAQRPVFAALAGFAAMAACVAFVVMRQAGVVEVSQVTPRPMVAALKPAATPGHLRLAAVDADEFKTVFAVKPAGLNDWHEPALAVADHFPAGLQVELPPLERVSAEDLNLDDRAVLQPILSRVIRSQQPMQASVEFAAFQFQR